MTVEFVDVLVEEPSAEAALELLLPKLLGDVAFQIHAHQGKLDLLAKLPARLSAWATWIPTTHRIVVLVDCDDDDCGVLKRRLERMASNAGLLTRSHSKKGAYVVVNRLAIEELEAWYFGDWAAVRAAYPRVAATVPAQARYRNPDGILGTWEAFERTCQKARYFDGGLRKIEAAREIAVHMDPDRNASPSFCALRDALREMVA